MPEVMFDSRCVVLALRFMWQHEHTVDAEDKSGPRPKAELSVTSEWGGFKTKQWNSVKPTWCGACWRWRPAVEVEVLEGENK